MSTDAADALAVLAALLGVEDSVISPHVRDPTGFEPFLGALAASGPQARAAPVEYALVVESVREGYLLHYGAPRIIADPEPDLALLAGDYLYALGLQRLSSLGDLGAVRELSDLISLAAQTHGNGRPADRTAHEADALWLACATAIAVGQTPEHELAKAKLRAEARDAAVVLRDGAARSAAAAGIGGELSRATEQLESARDRRLG